MDGSCLLSSVVIRPILSQGNPCTVHFGGKSHHYTTFVKMVAYTLREILHLYSVIYSTQMRLANNATFFFDVGEHFKVFLGYSAGMVLVF